MANPGRIETVELDRDVGVVAPAAAGGYVAAAAVSFLFVDESGTVTELASLTDAPSGVRFNDGACDDARPVLGRDDGLRQVAGRRGALPA